MTVFMKKYAHVLAALLVSAASVLPWLFVITGIRAWLSIAAALVGGIVLGLRSKVIRRSSRKVAMESAAALVLLLLFVSLDAPWHIVDLGRGVLSGFSRLSTTVLPATSARGLLVSPVIVIAVACWFVGRFEGTRPGSLKSLFPWMGIFLLATSFGASYNGAELVLGVILVASLLGWLVLRNQLARSYVERDPDETRTGRIMATLMPLLVIAVLAASFVYIQSTFSVVKGNAVGITRQAPDVTLEGANPSVVLATLRYSTDGSATPLFEVSGLAPKALPQSGAYALLPLATMSKYDGTSWSIEPMLPVNDGNALPLLAHANGWKHQFAIPTNGISVTVKNGAVAHGLNRYLPTPGGLLAGLRGADAVVDRASGFGVSTDLLPAGSSLTVIGASNLLGPPIVSAASEPLSPQVCKQLIPYLGLKQQGTSCAFAKVKATPLNLIEEAVARLQANGGVTPTRTSPGSSATDNTGQSFADISSTVLGSQHMATSEQYATFVALLARAVGLPSRIVTGFRVNPQTSSATLTPERSYTWTEVYAGGRWHVEDPTPSKVGKGSTQSGALSSQQLAADNTSGGDCQPPNCKVVVHPFSPRGEGNSLLRLLITVGEGLAVLAALMLIWALFVSMLRRRRLRKNRRGTAAQQIRGAVAELMLMRREFGHTARLAAATATELIDTVLTETGDDEVDARLHMISQVNLAFYGIDAEAELAPGDVWEWTDWVKSQYRNLASRRMKFRHRVFYARSAT